MIQLKTHLLPLSALLLTTIASGQTGVKPLPRMKSEGILIGGMILKNTYLSPLNYGGAAIGYYNETNRAYTKHVGNKFFSVTLGKTENPAGNAHIYALQGRLYGARQYYLYRGKWGCLYAGPGYNLGIGGLYSTRNGNNPASFQADGSLALSVGYAYRLNWQLSPILFRLSSHIDLLGTHWGQDFGESYYEMTYLSKSLGKKFNFTHIGNAYTQDIRLNIDIPIYKRAIISLMGTLEIQNWTINQIDNKRNTYVLGIGFTNYMESTGGKKWLRNNNSIAF